MDIQLYQDESLESILLRLSHEKGYERFSHFAEDIWHEVLVNSTAIPGAFSLSLDLINIYHANTTSQMRVRTLMHLEQQLGISNYGILRLALMHSKSIFSPNFKAINRHGCDYPFSFLRKRFTPICPHCLAEASYIRQEWQFIPIQACTKHKCQLIHLCPECGTRLEYQKTESIHYCKCGYDLSKASIQIALGGPLQVVQWLSGEGVFEHGLMNKQLSKSERYGFLLWYVHRYGDREDINFDAFIRYCGSWPNLLCKELDELIKKTDNTRVKGWKKVFFSEVFAGLLIDCKQLPSCQLSRNTVSTQVLAYFIKLMAETPIDPKGNISDVLLSPLEASTLLSCTVGEINRLYKFGEIKAMIRLKKQTNIDRNVSIFSLRSVIETKLTRMCSESDGLSLYLSEW